MSKFPCHLLLGVSFCIAPLMSQAASSDTFLCDATQASTNELPQLNNNCPIGKGLWGGASPKGKDSSFWIQCGLLNNPMPLKTAKVLYQHISTDVWMKAEGKALRCLIGPYEDYATAKKELTGVVSEAPYKDAFIREVRKGEQSSPVVSPKKTTPKKAKPLPVKAPVKVTPKPKVLPPVVKQTAEPKISSSKNAGVTIRRQTTINGLSYAVPYIMDEKIQFYMEHDLAWNRLSYADAEKVCQSQQMRLATEGEWAQLISSQVMDKDKWPVYLPYWGVNNKGLFTTGKVNKLKGTSLLNILCVK